jgi:hypothetical protein
VFDTDGDVIELVMSESLKDRYRGRKECKLVAMERGACAKSDVNVSQGASTSERQAGTWDLACSF